MRHNVSLPSKKPVLLLDVDGVLNVVSKDCVPRKQTLPDGHAFYPTPIVIPFMQWAWDHFHVFWLTAWFSGANAIAKWAKLEEVPALGNPREYGDYKLNAVQKIFGEIDIPVFWVEDGIGERAALWVAAKKNFAYFETNPYLGLTREIVDALADRANVPRLIVP